MTMRHRGYVGIGESSDYLLSHSRGNPTNFRIHVKEVRPRSGVAMNRNSIIVLGDQSGTLLRQLKGYGAGSHIFIPAKLVPPLMARIPDPRDQELHVLIALALGFATAAVTQALGLSSLLSEGSRLRPMESRRRRTRMATSHRGTSAICLLSIGTIGLTAAISFDNLNQTIPMLTCRAAHRRRSRITIEIACARGYLQTHPERNRILFSDTGRL